MCKYLIKKVQIFLRMSEKYLHMSFFLCNFARKIDITGLNSVKK